MLSNELNSLAAQIEDCERLKSGRPIDPTIIAQKLRILAMGVSALEAVKIAEGSHAIPAEIRGRALQPRPLHEAAALLAQTAHLAEEALS